MPVYEFECQNCHEILEYNLKISEPSPTECSNCKQPQLKRIISSTSFQLKGSGWYSDHYGIKSPKAANTDQKEKPQSSQASSDSPTQKSDVVSKKPDKINS